MAFYLNPPDGLLSLNETRLAILTRFKFLAEIYRVGGGSERVWSEVLPKFAAEAEYLMEGTVTDRCAYFLLRLVAHVDPLLLEFVTHCERLLFKVRMDALNSAGVWKIFAKLRRHLFLASMAADGEERNKWQLISEAIAAMLKSRGGSQQLADAFTKQITATQHFFVPFTFVLPLIRRRQVELNGGLAEILSTDLPVVLTGIFDKITVITAKRSRNAFCRTMLDERFVHIANELKAIAYAYGINFDPQHSTVKNRSKMNSEQIDQFSLLFPACMRHLHRELRDKHRLKHHQRIQYTLYLKEIGLPLSEAVKFWSGEYAKKASDSGKKTAHCQHSWGQDQRKYEYSLRHMYGLEGARKNYSAHCCNSLQSRNDGCVFRSFDHSHLKAQLVGDFGLSSTEFETCLHLVADGFLSEACRYVKSVVTKRVLSSPHATQVHQRTSALSERDNRNKTIFCRVRKNIPIAGVYQSQPVVSCALSKMQSFEPDGKIESCFDHPLCRVARTVECHRKPSEYFSEMLHIRGQ